MKIENAVVLVTGACLDEVLADELTEQVKRGMTAARPSYLPQGV